MGLRKLGLVTDDYIVIADYLKTEKPHTFNNLFQMKGFQEPDAPGEKFLRHDVQFNPDTRMSAQFTPIATGIRLTLRRSELTPDGKTVIAGSDDKIIRAFQLKL